jgi:hypothetical protein
MTLTSRNILSIIQCAFYAPTTVLSLFLCIRHCCRGEKAQIAWVFFYMYCHVRVAEAALGLATITYPSAAIYGTSILFSLIGVPILLLTTYGLLRRVYMNLAKSYPTGIKAWYFALLQLPFQGAIPLTARGASNSTVDLSDNGVFTPQILTKLGVMLCVVGFVVMVVLNLAIFRRQELAGPSEQKLLYAVTLTLPFLTVRLIYTILTTFMNDGLFQGADGNVLVIGLMVLLPEILVSVVYMVAGFALPRMEKDKRKGKKKCSRGKKRGGWPSESILLEDASITKTNSEDEWKDVDVSITKVDSKQSWKDIDDRISGVSHV